ncbi:uncharacterized protein [Dendrobates tinctorius]|uniref:uncharacterized protein n=1 Tax=Dendrobates tinctorius TaxID=92724 RepID=UPI003CC93634
MSSSGSPPSHRQRNEEAEPEGLSEGDGRSGEMPGVGSPHASESVARPRVPQSASQSRRQPRRGGRHRVRFFFFRTFIRFVHNAVIVMFTFFVFKQASQRAHDSDSEDVAIDVDLLIDMVRDREPLWNMADRFHADACVTRRLWEEVCQAVLSNWEELHSRAQKEQRERVQLRWRSMRDRFKKEFNKEMQAPSGSRGRRSRYKYSEALSFLRSTMVTRSTFSSTREPALNPSGAIPQEAVTMDHNIPNPSAPSLPSLVCDPSAPSTSAGASVQASLHEAAVDEVGFPLPHPSDTAALYRTPLSSGRLRQRAVGIPNEHSTIRRARVRR